MPETEYVACIFGIEPDLPFTTDIKTVSISTEERQGTWIDGVTFDIACTQTSSFGAILDYTVAGPDVTWLSFVDFKEKFDLDFKGDATAFVTSERNRFDQVLSSSAKSWTDYLRSQTHFEETWNNMSADTEYVAVAVGISIDGKLITEPSEPIFFRKKEGTGVGIVKETEHFRFTITNLTTEKCNWAVESIDEPGANDYMYAEAFPPEGYADMAYGPTDPSDFNRIATEIFDKEVCRSFWNAPSEQKYLAAYPMYYQKAFLADPDGLKFEFSFRDMVDMGYDITKPAVLLAFPASPQLVFVWSTFDWDNEVYPRSTYGPVEQVEFTAPQPEPDPAASYLPADADPADRMHYYRLAHQ